MRIIARARAMVVRIGPSRHPARADERDSAFLDRLIDALRLSRQSSNAILESAGRHGRALLDSGFTVAQVVHDYGGVCQAVTQLAGELNAHITPDEFHTFNRCLDDAIAQPSQHTRARGINRWPLRIEAIGGDIARAS